jgi:hypothetical protein
LRDGAGSAGRSASCRQFSLSAAEPQQCRQGCRASQRAEHSATCLRRSFSVCYLARTRRSSRSEVSGPSVRALARMPSF